MRTLLFARVKSPVGPLALFAEGDRLVACAFDPRESLGDVRPWLASKLGEHALKPARDPAGAATRLKRYFGGDLHAIDDQPLALHGTEFQERVWRGLTRIPAGRTLGYAEFAKRLGVPRAFRAVGAANGANPIAVFVPCHRVLAANGTLHGYGGGLDKKRWLLAHEGARFVGREREAQLELI
jgi:methylated-DNA-[protein]-cysteine S-methyltransferase